MFNLYRLRQGVAPEPSDAVTPKRTGLRSATSSVNGGSSDGVIEVVVKPDDSAVGLCRLNQVDP
jgi:hypothetical protein